MKDDSFNPQPKQAARDDELPRIDIFVTCCGEAQDVIIDTVIAACNQDYPKSLWRVVVLDDGHSESLKTAITNLHKCRYPNLTYTSRNVDVQTHSKAANLNFGLRHMDQHPLGSAEFVAVLDADMITASHWLRTVISYLIHDARAGLACPSQRFYNIPSGDPLGMTHGFVFAYIIILLQHLAGEAICSGTGFVVRRRALDQISGFPEGSILEDFLTSIFLSTTGWSTIYVPGFLQWGLAADTYPTWIKQRQHWTAGLFLVAQILSSARAKGLPRALHNTIMLLAILDSSASLCWTGTLIMLPLCVLTGQPLVPTLNSLFLCRLALLDFAAQSTCYALGSAFVDWRMSLMANVAAIWTAPYQVAITFRCYILPKLLGYPVPCFKPTGTPAIGQAERQARSKGWGSCMKVVMYDCHGWMFLLLLASYLVGIIYSLQTAAKTSVSSSDHLGLSLFTRFMESLLLRMAWPPLAYLLIVSISNVWTPIAYSIRPPPVIARTDLITKDKFSSVASPKKTAMRTYKEKPSQSLWIVTAMCYLAAVSINEGIHWQHPS